MNQGVGRLHVREREGGGGRETERKKSSGKKVYDTTPQYKGWTIDASQNIATCLARETPYAATCRRARGLIIRFMLNNFACVLPDRPGKAGGVELHELESLRYNRAIDPARP